MPGLINGLFASRAGISSHGIAISVVSDNLANSSTIGFKTGRTEFNDMVSQGQVQGKVIGSGSSVNAIVPVMDQGTLEYTGRDLDLGIEGNGFFAVSDGTFHYYTRAGNFKLDENGYLVNQNGLQVLGFPEGGSGLLEPLNLTDILQSNIKTTELDFAGNVNASSPIISAASIPTTDVAGVGNASTTTYADLNNVADHSTVVEVYDSQGGSHTMTYFFFHTGTNEYQVRAYVNSEDVDTAGTATGLPRLVSADGTVAGGTITMTFNGDGTRTNPPVTSDMNAVIPWNNGANSSTIAIDFGMFTQYSDDSNISSIKQDGKGVGSIERLDIQEDGTIMGVLTNGQVSKVGTLGLVNFANPEGLIRIGNQLLQQSLESGEPVVGSPSIGTMGVIRAGEVELSTVDIANEFVKLITLQRSFQANSRMISSINQLMGEIIQLV